MAGSHLASRAVDDALKHGKAILKFLSANDVGATRSHQSGFLLPKAAWTLYTPNAPMRGVNLKSQVAVKWPDGLVTESVVTWYGKAKSEYRLTGGFHSAFPFVDPDSVGSLLVIVPVDHANLLAYVLDTDDDVAEIQAALGLEVMESWGIYDSTSDAPESPGDCIDREFRAFVGTLTEWPSTAEMSAATREAIIHCVRDFLTRSADAQLVELVEAEFRLFKMAERLLCTTGPFASIDEFLAAASSIMNRRKSRAGWSLESHFAHILTLEKIPFTARPIEIEGAPDIVIPSVAAYLDPTVPRDRVCLLAVKTTCKDRWRQITREGAGVARRHLLTLQRGISENQLAQMEGANVSLVVPESLHADYPASAQLLRVEDFIQWARKLVMA